MAPFLLRKGCFFLVFFLIIFGYIRRFFLASSKDAHCGNTKCVYYLLKRDIGRLSNRFQDPEEN